MCYYIEKQLIIIINNYLTLKDLTLSKKTCNFVKNRFTETS